MIVKDLIEALQEMPQDAMVVQSKDGEGNGFSPVAGIMPGRYWTESTYSGEFDDSADDDLESDGSQLAVALWPTN